MKYPRTLHLPFSPGAGSDDKISDSVDFLLNKEVVITEKLDGSNCSLTNQNVFARTHATPARHASFNLIKSKHAKIKYMISPDELIFGENCYAIHSIEYSELPSEFFTFGVLQGNQWLSWNQVKSRAQELGLATAPELGVFNFTSLKELKKTVESLCSQSSIYGGPREGVVIRATCEFSNEEFEKHVLKWVREGHVQTDEHWSLQPIRPQKIKGLK